MKFRTVLLYSFLFACLGRYLRVSIISNLLIINFAENVPDATVNSVVFYGTFGAIIIDTILNVILIYIIPHIARTFFKEQSLLMLRKARYFLRGDKNAYI